MQIGELDIYINRTVYYCCRQLSESLAGGDDYGRIKKSIVISFVKGKLFPSETPFHSVYTMCERNTKQQLTDIMELHYIELDKIKYDCRQLNEMSGLEKLGVYIRCSGKPEEKEYVETLVREGGEVIQMTDRILRKVSEEEKLRELRIAREKMEMWIAMEKAAGYDAGKNDGYVEGKAEGFGEGEESGKIQMAKEIATNLKKAGIDVSIIADNTGLPRAEIEKL